jgi:hypothetical protein
MARCATSVGFSEQGHYDGGSADMENKAPYVLRWSLAAVAMASLIAGCGHKSNSDSSGKSPAASGARAAVWSGAPLRGNDPKALRSYLETVEEVRAKRFDVHWSPATVAVDKAAALRSLQGVSRDGGTFTFDATEPSIAALKPGSILWVWDIAVRKVDAIDTVGGLKRVHTSEVRLSEAIPDAQIEFEAPLKLQNYFPQRQIEPPAPSARHRRPGNPYLMNVSLTDLPPEDLPDPNTYKEQEENDDDWYDEGITQNGFNGTKNGWAYSVGYQTRQGGITVELQARKGDLEGASDSSTHTLIPEYKQIELDREDLRKSLDKAVQDLNDEEKGIRDTDKDFQQQMQQLLEDQTNRRNPNYLGPSIPPQVNRYGEPINDQAAQQLLKDRWQKQHDLEVQKLQATEQILGEWRTKKRELDARKRALKVVQSVAAQLWQLADDNFDARFRGRVDLDGFAIGGQFGFVNGDVNVASTQFKDINGNVQVQFIGRLGKPGNEATKVPVMHIPINFNVPIPVGGIPFVVQLGSDFLITLSLSGLHATISVDGQAAFHGDTGLTYAKGQASYESSFPTPGEPQITNVQGMSPGASAVVLAIQLPRIGLGLGVFGVSSAAYLDVVHAVTLTQAGAVGAGLLPLCKRATYQAVGHVGIETNIVSLPFVDTSAISNALSTQKHEFFNRMTKLLDPPVKGCDI